MLGEAHSAVREELSGCETSSADQTSPNRFRTCTAHGKTKKSLPRFGRADSSGQRSHRLPYGVSDLFLGRVGQQKAVNIWKSPLSLTLTS